jgi:hypothetical protein
MRKFQIAEPIIILLILLLAILRLLDVKVDMLLYLSLALLEAFWIAAYFAMRKQHVRGFSGVNIIEKLLISLLMWAIVMNITLIPLSGLLSSFSLIILVIYFFVSFTKRIIKNPNQWFVAIERLLLALIFAGFLFKFQSWSGNGLIRVLSFAMLIVIMPLGIITELVKNKDYEIRRVLTSLIPFYIGIDFMLIFLLFDCMHWPAAFIYFLPGMFLMAIGALLTIIGYRKIQDAEILQSIIEPLARAKKNSVNLWWCSLIFFGTEPMAI